MARRVKSQTPSALAQLLESGKPIAGRVGYVQADRYKANVFIKVKVLRLESKECGIGIIVSPLSGKGEFSITPCEWFDDTKSIEDARVKAEKVDAAKADYRSVAKRPHYLSARRSELEKYVAERMTKAQRKDFEQHVSDCLGGKTIAQIPTVGFLEDVAKKAACVVNGLDGEDADELRHI